MRSIQEDAEDLAEACVDLRTAVTELNDRSRTRRQAASAHQSAKRLVESTEEMFETMVERHNCADALPDDERIDAAVEGGNIPEEVTEIARAAKHARSARNELFYVCEDMPSPQSDDYEAAADNVEYYLDSITEALS